MVFWGSQDLLPLNNTTWGRGWPRPGQGIEEVPHWWRCWSTGWGKEPEEPTWWRPYGWFPPYTCEQPVKPSHEKQETISGLLYSPLVYWWFLQLQGQRGEHKGLVGCGKSSHLTCKQSPAKKNNKITVFSFPKKKPTQAAMTASSRGLAGERTLVPW